MPSELLRTCGSRFWPSACKSACQLPHGGQPLVCVQDPPSCKACQLLQACFSCPPLSADQCVSTAKVPLVCSALKSCIPVKLQTCAGRYSRLHTTLPACPVSNPLTYYSPPDKTKGSVCLSRTSLAGMAAAELSEACNTIVSTLQKAPKVTASNLHAPKLTAQGALLKLCDSPIYVPVAGHQWSRSQ